MKPKWFALRMERTRPSAPNVGISCERTMPCLAFSPPSLSCLPHRGAAIAGDAEVKAAQGVIDGQLKAFRQDDNAAAYDYAAPTIKRIFPTLDSFMSMVTRGYAPVHKPKSYAFGKSEEMGGNSVIQQVLIVGPDGKDYEAVYTLELQPDGATSSLASASGLPTRSAPEAPDVRRLTCRTSRGR